MTLKSLLSSVHIQKVCLLFFTLISWKIKLSEMD